MEKTEHEHIMKLEQAGLEEEASEVVEIVEIVWKRGKAELERLFALPGYAEAFNAIGIAHAEAIAVVCSFAIEKAPLLQLAGIPAVTDMIRGAFTIGYICGKDEALAQNSKSGSDNVDG